MTELTYASVDDLKSLGDHELAHTICFFLSNKKDADWWTDESTIGCKLLNEWGSRNPVVIQSKESK